jgi:tetratricopeptide (TPR) repeat protein
MAPAKRSECKKQVSDKAERCPHCGAPVTGPTGKKQKKWHERTSVTLCIAAALIVVTFGFIHIITGVVSPYGLPFDIVLKDSFGYRETFVDAEKINALPYLAARIRYPLGCKVLQKEDYMESGTVFETRMTRHLQTDMRKWQAEFEQSLGRPQQQWQDQLQGQTHALQTSPEDPNACNNRGIASAREGQYETAIAEFTRAFRRNPVFAEAYYNRGLVSLAIGQLGQAISDFTKVVEIKPGFTEGYTSRGILHVAMSQYDQAIGDFTKVLELEPARAEMYLSRSLAFFAKGQYDKAWQDVHRIQDLGLSVPAEFLESLRAASGQ